MLDFIAQVDALFTHGTRLNHRRTASATCHHMTAARLFCFRPIAGAYFVGFGTKQPSWISWVTALAGIELTILGPLQSSTPGRCARSLAFAVASSSLAHISGSNPVR
jgi:hypothetical protein